MGDAANGRSALGEGVISWGDAADGLVVGIGSFSLDHGDAVGDGAHLEKKNRNMSAQVTHMTE